MATFADRGHDQSEKVSSSAVVTGRVAAGMLWPGKVTDKGGPFVCRPGEGQCK